MMTSFLIYFADYHLQFFVTEMYYHLQNFRRQQYYFHCIIQQLMAMNIFLWKSHLFQETDEKAIVLNYDVINQVIMMQCIY